MTVNWKFKSQAKTKTIVSEAEGANDSAEPDPVQMPAAAEPGGTAKDTGATGLMAGKNPSLKLYSTLAVMAALMAILLTWWLGPNGYFFAFDPYKFEKMTPTERTLAGLGVHMRVARARLTHNANWMRRSLLALGNYRLCSGDESGAQTAYEEATRYIHDWSIDRPEMRTLVALYARQGRWHEAHELLSRQIPKMQQTQYPNWGANTDPIDYSKNRFYRIGVLVCKKVGDKKGQDVNQLLVDESDNPGRLPVFFQNPNDVFMKEGCTNLVRKNFAKARSSFEALRDPDLEKRDQMRGAVMCFVTSVVAGDDQAAERDYGPALEAYVYFQSHPDSYREQAVFQHQAAAFLRKRGRTAEANSYQEAESKIRARASNFGRSEINDPEFDDRDDIDG